MTLEAGVPSGKAVLVLADGRVFWGKGIGVPGQTGGEICFNTSMTGYQEILTDPSYAGQIITFTFPHIGNVGTNQEDNEHSKPFSKGLILRADITRPSNFRSEVHLNDWLKGHGVTGICGVDTRALTRHLRDGGAQNGVIAYAEEGVYDLDALKKQVQELPDMNGLDLAADVSCSAPYPFGPEDGGRHVVVVDYGVKRHILNCLAGEGLRLTVVPCRSAAADILALKPDGVFLSNGPGDPAATGVYAVPVIAELLKANLPIFGICMGHQMLAQALGGKTGKMPFGHRGANQPVLDAETGKVEITSQNHGFHVLEDSLPEGVLASHKSLFDATNEGLSVKGALVFSVQHHPEASPGPQDSRYLFKRFADILRKAKQEAA